MNWAAGVIDKTVRTALPVPTVTTTAVLAAAIADRYGSHRVTVSGVELALAYDAPGELNYFQEAPQITIAPHVSVGERRPFAPVVREIPAMLAGSREFGPAQAELLFERLFSRRARVPSFAAPRDREPQRTGESTLGSDLRRITARDVEVVERILPRPPAMEKAPEVAEPVAMRPVLRGEERPAPVSTAAPFKSVTLAPPEIKRVAEQVIREIDHRIVARRERMGRR